MAEQQALIDWPLTPSYRLGQLWDPARPSLLEQGRYVPRLLGKQRPQCTVICTG